MNQKIKALRKKAMALPLEPGVYIMKNKEHDIIYIGKAKALKNRVSQYFGSQNNHPEKVRRMVENVDDFEYIITDSEFEALILECSLIKQHSPKYNILLKDDKGYSYVRISDEPYKRISYVLRKSDDGAIYLGPYKSSFYVKQSVEQAQKIFRLPTCSRRFPEDIRKSRPCLNFHIKQCCGVCTGKVSLKEYNEYVNEALDFLKGGSASSIKTLTENMQKASDNLDFERAAKIRDRINAVKKMRDRQKVVDTKIDEQDVIAFAADEKKGVFEVFRFAQGRLFDRESFVVDDPGDEISARSEFITRYYSMRNDVPRYVTLDMNIDDSAVVEKWLSDKKQKRVYITVPEKGAQKDIVNMCKNNAVEALAQSKGVTGRQYTVLEQLKTLLGLENVPRYIESYDISNLAGTENVAGMVVFEDAKPNRQAYRRFKIKTFDGQDDCNSMREVITRRLTEYTDSVKNEQESAQHNKTAKRIQNNGFSRLPDLILLDGGKAQVAAVRPIVEQFALDIPVFGMVKDDKHRTRAITSTDGEIAISPHKPLFAFITSVQDEVHRFVIDYHHNRRKKSMIGSSLTKINGIGEKRAKELLRYFRTVANISRATIDELENAPSMTHDSAVSVYRYYHSEEKE